MTRRTFLATTAALAAQTPARTSMGIATTSFSRRRFADTLSFLDYCHSLGAGGIQASLTSTAPEFVKKLRARVEELGMFLEVMAGLPRQDLAAFERAVSAAKDAGALCLRVACLGGRRYETFDSMEAWKKFVADSKTALERAVPVLEKHRLRMAVENHKDWTTEEMVPLLKSYSSQYVGICLDTGNNIAMLDDWLETAEAFAPYAFSTHIKDMGVELYEDGFLLSEVPLGEGYVDLRKIMELVRKHHPQTRMTLEMITRNPLRIPCLTEKYWATWPERPAFRLARMLRTVREKAGRQPLPRVESLDREAQARLEEDNVKQCLHYARQQLGA